MDTHCLFQPPASNSDHTCLTHHRFSSEPLPFGSSILVWLIRLTNMLVPQLFAAQFLSSTSSLSLCVYKGIEIKNGCVRKQVENARGG